MSSKNTDLNWAHPLVQEWFRQHFGSPTGPQIEGWPSILAGQPTLISAPTGSGKTLAAFLVCIDKLVRLAVKHDLPDHTDLIYISPLKALSNDIQKNLLLPLYEIEQIAAKKKITLAPIRIAVRTGDTPANERQKMLKKPPHILVTTPESFYILLTAEKSRLMLSHVTTVIVDEIHALVNNKRGTHLSLSLERLQTLTEHPFTRIGLSATQKPIEKVAAFLVGNGRSMPTIINIGHMRHIELDIVVPPDELGPIASNELWDDIYDQIAHIVKKNRTTLVFVNTRRLAERIAHHLTERIGEEKVAAHHGSLSQKLRLDAETKLKNGDLKVLVATASLELGIDIGHIDIVIIIGSPRAIATSLQRIGRAGHWHGAISKAKIFATTRNELLECAALSYAIKQGDLDELIIPYQPLDILSQQMIAACATHEWQEQALYHMVTRAYPYKDLSLETFHQLLTMLSDGIAGSRGRYGTYLFRDQVNHNIRARRGSRITAILNGGAIAETGLFTVLMVPAHTVVGTLDEDFAVESNRGDIILLGTNSWRIQRVESRSGKVLVEDAHGLPPSVPFWRGEAPARSNELSRQVSVLKQKINELLPLNAPPIDEPNKPASTHAAIDWLKKYCCLDQSGAEQLLAYLQQGREVLGVMPTQETIVAERFFDESGGMQLIIHSPFGARINKAWGLALRKKFCRAFNFELQAAATDDGINIALTEQHSFPLSDVFHFLHPNSVKEVVIQAVLQSPLFAARWRASATRSLALPRFRMGKKIPPNILRMLSDDLLAAVFPNARACQDNLAGQDIVLPDHPITHEAMKEALHDTLDIDGFIQVLQGIYSGTITCIAIDTPQPSVFSHEILNANPYAFLDDAPLEERRARAVAMRRMLPLPLLEEIGKLDSEAIAAVKEQALPDIRDRDELHDFLQTVVVYPVSHAWMDPRASLCHPRAGGDPATQNWHEFFAQLKNEHRVLEIKIAHQDYWIAVEKIFVVAMLYPDVSLPSAQEKISREEALLTVLRGWLLHTGPMTSAQLSQLLTIDEADITAALIQLESTGFILRGHFTASHLEWCERRLLARIHRMTVEKLRKEIAPVTPLQFMSFILTWQHAAKNTHAKEQKGLFKIIQQLQGCELPANIWERDIFSTRIEHYDSSWLDQLCFSGAIGWGRLSQPKTKRVKAKSNLPITFFVRNECDWVLENHDDVHVALSPAAKEIHTFLLEHGASFLQDIETQGSHLKSEIEAGLGECVAAGLVTADSFDNLRGIIEKKRRLRHRRHGRTFGYHNEYSGGRWSILKIKSKADKTKALEELCLVLLRRYGIVFRDLLKKEKNLPTWRELLITFRHLESRGEVRGGRFVAGFLGEQFALPHAFDALRASVKSAVAIESAQLSPLDPLNAIRDILLGP